MWSDAKGFGVLGTTAYRTGFTAGGRCAKLELTAVVDPLRSVGDPDDRRGPRAAERYRFGVETMERQRDPRDHRSTILRVQRTTAQRELGL